MTEKFMPYDPADDLRTEEAVSLFMEDALETEDANYIAHAFGVVARAKGMTEVAKKAGLSREQLYRSCSEQGNPTLKTLLSVLKALDIQLTIKPRDTNKAA